MSRPDDYEPHNLLAEIPYESLSEQARILIRVGKLSPQQVSRVTDWQSKRGLSFASAAIDLGYVRREDLMLAISRQYSYPVLSGDSDRDQFSSELVVGHNPFSFAAEAVRSIRTSIVSTAIGQGTRSFVVTAPRRGSGCTYFAANIALAFAQMSMPTLLVDTNLRNPRVAEMFGIERNTEGLSNTLRRRDLRNVPIINDIIQGLSILTAGDMPPNPQELLSSAQFLALSNNLERRFGVVIYDTAAAMEFADASIVVARVGAAIIVARQHQTTFDDVSTLSRKFRASQCKFLGTVMNAF